MDGALFQRGAISLKLLGILALLYIVQIFVYAFLISPVRHIPGPCYASALLATYGHVVVIAPNQVHTNDEEAMKIIYNRKSLKTPFYASMGSWKGVTSTLGFVDYASAAPTRNNLIQCFQNKNLATLVENISSHISEFCELLRRTTKGNGDVDGVVIFRLLALDIVTDVLWGEQKTLLSSLSDTTPEFLRRFHAFSSYNAMKSFFPGFDTYVRYFGTPKWRQLRQDCSDMDVTAKDALSRWHSEGGHRDKDVLGMLLSMHEAVDERKRVPKDHIPAYMVEMMAAGSSTTSHTATFTCHQLAYHPEIQHKLRKELKTAFPDSANIDEKEMMDLPMLDAVLRETMRSMPMIPGPLERLLGEAVTVDRLQIPSGVIASTAAYDQCRLPSVFPDPESWHPERWFEASDAMHLNWIPFGYGSRSCPGSNLAMTELKYMIGTTFRLFQVGPPENHAQEPLELRDVFVSAQKSGQCWLRFKEDA